MLVMSRRYIFEEALHELDCRRGRAAGTCKMQNINTFAYLKMTLRAIVNFDRGCGFGVILAYWSQVASHSKLLLRQQESNIRDS